MQLSSEGPTINEVELIGLELSVQPMWGGDVELEIFKVKRTIPRQPGDRHTARVTIHTSNGDITMRCPLLTGQYQAY